MQNVAKNTSKKKSKDIKILSASSNIPSDSFHVTRAIKIATPIETKQQSNKTNEGNVTI